MGNQKSKIKNLKLSCCLLPTAICLLFTATSFANTNYVGTAGTSSGNYYTDIQSAVDATLAGGLVLVSNGVYDTGGAMVPYGSGELTNRVVILRNITIRSISGPQSTIIVGSEGVTGGSGTGAVRCVYFDVTDAVLSGFTLSNGHTLVHGDETWDKSGGGALMGYGSVITNCIITGCSAGNLNGGGGGVYIYYDGTIDDCVLFNNGAEFGAGVYMYSFGSDGVIKNSIFRDNTAGYDGGAIRMEKGLLINCVISNNTSKGSAGGVSCFDSSIVGCRIENNSAMMESGGSGGGISAFKNMKILDCEIINNSSYSGGGIDCHSNYGNTISNCVISGNLVSYSGGGVDFGAKSELLNCLINDNFSSNYGGGVYFTYGGTIRNCTIVSNYANNGGGVYCDNNASNLNSIVYFNTAINGTNYANNGSLTDIIYEYCCTFPQITNGVGNISDNPLFSTNFFLSVTSPCINTGTNAYAPMPVDLAGNPRIVGGRVDMGCYELVPEGGMVFSILCSVFGIFIYRRKFIFSFQKN